MPIRFDDIGNRLKAFRLGSGLGHGRLSAVGQRQIGRIHGEDRGEALRGDAGGAAARPRQRAGGGRPRGTRRFPRGVR